MPSSPTAPRKPSRRPLPGLADGSVQVFAGPLHGKDADGNELNLAEGEYYKENEKGSSPTFTYIVDGVTVLS